MSARSDERGDVATVTTRPAGRDTTLVSRWAHVQGLSVHARVGRPWRNAPPLVMVPGLGVSSQSLEPAAIVLARDFAVYVPELPGAGRTQRPTRALCIPELARALLEWLDAMALERASFVASSMGCQVAIELAIMAPERVDRLVLIGPTVDRRYRGVLRQVPRWMLEALREPRSLLPILVRDYLSFGPIRFAQTAAFALADRIEDKLSLVHAPTLVLRGQRDAFVSQPWAEETAHSLRAGRWGVVPGAAHAAYYSAPERLAALVRPFVRGQGLPMASLERLSIAARDRRATAATDRAPIAMK